jgi:hypothetical protein
MIVNKELARMWKEALVAYLGVISALHAIK